MLDPSRIAEPATAAAASIESVIVDRREVAGVDNLRIGPRLRELQIDYTSPTFTVSEKVTFRYKLDPYDDGWHDAGARRQAFYTDVPPGTYTFRVMAINSIGLWNERAATLTFSVVPAFYQTIWFRTFVAVLSVGLLWSAYQWRVRQIRHRFELTLDARVSERTRIARDLHDTLLQSFQGALLQFQSVAKVMKTRPDEAAERLERALDQAEAAITEGRDTVHGLRASATTVNDLANGIAALGAELTSVPTAVAAPAIDVDVDGASRDLNPLVCDETYRIAGEALRNAVKHAQARRVTVTIHYEPRQLRLVIHDDGRGIDTETMHRQQVAGHFGLPGMRERAAIVKGQLEVRSVPGAGTEIELRVPAAIAYSVSARHAWWPRVLG
jgi:signal transduction histidine kinase